MSQNFSMNSSFYFSPLWKIFVCFSYNTNIWHMYICIYTYDYQLTDVLHQIDYLKSILNQLSPSCIYVFGDKYNFRTFAIIASNLLWYVRIKRKNMYLWRYIKMLLSFNNIQSKLSIKWISQDLRL